MSATLVMGATPRADRYANLAIRSLVRHNQKVIAYGRESGEVQGIPIENEWNPDWTVDTITLYLSPRNQEMYYDDMIALKPKRVIFNPGTENPALFKLLRESGIEVEVGCTLVMLSTNQYNMDSNFS